MTLKILTREEIEKKREIKIEVEPVPEWGEDVAVGLRYWSGADRDRFDMELQRRKPNEEAEIDLMGMKAWCLAMSLCDENGVQLYTEEDVDGLNQLDGIVIGRLFKKTQDMNGIGEKVVKDLEGNLTGVQSADNGSDSPDSSEDEQ